MKYKENQKIKKSKSASSDDRIMRRGSDRVEPCAFRGAWIRQTITRIGTGDAEGDNGTGFEAMRSALTRKVELYRDKLY
jgi:hypothetical protein